MTITRKEVEHVANLARLELTPEEAERMTAQLDAILGYAAKLEELDTSAMDRTDLFGTGQGIAMRDDENAPSLSREKALQNGPDHDGQSFVVPRVIN